MTEKNLRERYEAVRAMHELVVGLNDEGAYFDHWIYLVPDCPMDSDFWHIASDLGLFKDVCRCFYRVIRDYGEDGFYIGGVLA